MDRRTFEGLSAFAMIVDRGSFVRAAAQLGVTPSALSQTIRQLEDRLGVRLLHRTTRSIAPSAAGEKLLARLRPMLSELDAAVAATTASAKPDTPSGPLRITCSWIAGELIVAPRLGAFTAGYPAVAPRRRSERGSCARGSPSRSRRRARDTSRGAAWPARCRRPARA